VRTAIGAFDRLFDHACKQHPASFRQWAEEVLKPAVVG
jgi:hypothetical protein